MHILKNKERNQVLISSYMRETPKGRAFWARTAARMISEMAPEDKMDSEKAQTMQQREIERTRRPGMLRRLQTPRRRRSP